MHFVDMILETHIKNNKAPTGYTMKELDAFRQIVEGHTKEEKESIYNTIINFAMIYSYFERKVKKELKKT